ncbi:L,D-transpeptidase YcbB [Azospirillaceae bacterium]
MTKAARFLTVFFVLFVFTTILSVATIPTAAAEDDALLQFNSAATGASSVARSESGAGPGVESAVKTGPVAASESVAPKRPRPKKPRVYEEKSRVYEESQTKAVAAAAAAAIRNRNAALALSAASSAASSVGDPSVGAPSSSGSPPVRVEGGPVVSSGPAAESNSERAAASPRRSAVSRKSEPRPYRPHTYHTPPSSIGAPSFDGGSFAQAVGRTKPASVNAASVQSNPVAPVVAASVAAVVENAEKLAAAASAAPASASSGETAVVPAPVAAPTTLNQAIMALLSRDTLRALDRPALDTTRVRRFYADRNYDPAWFSSETLTPAVESLRRFLESVDAEGLTPSDYHLAAIQTRLQATDLMARAELDVLLSDALMGYAADVRSGRLAPSVINYDFAVSPVVVDVVAVAKDVVAASDLKGYMSKLGPSNPGYVRLREALRTHRAIERAGGWSKVRQGPKLEVGASDPMVRDVRRRLASSGEYKEKITNSDVYDATLKAAVQAFQARHGLENDGVIGASTQEAMNVSVGERIASILASMERLRWMPDEMGNRYVMVNIPSFTLKIVDHGAMVHEMPVIVGTKVRQTPIFNSKITSLILNPTWTVPLKLAREDILPKLRRDPNYLANHGIQLFSSWNSDASVVNPENVDWQSSSITQFRLRQDPGNANALGRVKFNIPNRFDVYLHDTPHREKFEKVERSFSSGCVRVGNPMVLADFLLSDMSEWSPERREKALESHGTRWINLKTPTAVYLLYQTAWQDGNGLTQFREDIYGRDAQLLRALNRRVDSSAKLNSANANG